ncbi:MAG: ABC transporter permease subunit [Candidatus Latescibacteria bacterium]|nr:ABC transporter permease subunit [Candidatus Latescibacterota bacterium]
MDFNVIIEHIPLYIEGLWVTVQLVVLALIFGLVLAVPLALMAVSGSRFTAFWSKAYIYFFRGTPLLVQMFMIYHGAGQFELLRESVLWVVFKEAYWCALIAFSLNTAAYTGEILRGAIAQTSFGEIEAAKAYGMSRATQYWRIILPSAVRRALPSYSNEVIFMLHGSALAGVITIIDLSGAAKIVNSRHFVPFEAFMAAGLFYLGLTFLIVWGFKIAQTHWHAYMRPREEEGQKGSAAASA